VPQLILAKNFFMRKPEPDPRDPLVADPYSIGTLYAQHDPTLEQLGVLEATDGLYNLIQQYGAKRVMCWIRSLAALAGQECE
jgi:hypothetical protein